MRGKSPRSELEVTRRTTLTWTRTDPPTVLCGAPDGLWHAANVSISCFAYDENSGLANPADAAFSLSTTVPIGSEDGNASTGSRQVCDVAGHRQVQGRSRKQGRP
jgi:hypothetical protein